VNGTTTYRALSLLSLVSSPVLEHTQLSAEWTPGIFLGVKTAEALS